MTPCPVWSGDEPEHSLTRLALTRSVCDRASARAARVSPDRTEVESWHLEMFKDVVPLDYYAGNCRQLSMTMPCLADDNGVAGSLGSYFGQVLREVEDLFTSVNRRITELDARWRSSDGETRRRLVASLVGCAVGTFIRIHPFKNGNGRTSRVLWGVLLKRAGFPQQIGVLRRPADPYPSVMRAAMQGDNGPAVAMVYAGILAAEKRLPVVS